MGRKRTQIQIFTDALYKIENSHDGLTFSNIRRYAGLSPKKTGEIIDKCVERDYIRETIGPNGSRTYTLTAKGSKFLRMYEDVKPLFDLWDREIYP